MRNAKSLRSSVVRALKNWARQPKRILLKKRRRPIAILMRYSILRRASGSWLLNRTQGFEEYRASLFADERLTQRLTALTHVVLPSLLAQTVPLDARWHRLIIVTSTELPARHLKALGDAVAPYPWVKIAFAAPDERPDYPGETLRFLQEIRTRSGPFATARLDDDDALAKTYMERLTALITPANVGKVVTFPRGYNGTYNAATGSFDAFYPANKPFTAIGLAAIEHFDGTGSVPRSIFGFGNHARMGTEHAYLADDTFPSYIRSIYPEQDTARKDRRHDQKVPIPASQVRKHIG